MSKRFILSVISLLLCLDVFCQSIPMHNISARSTRTLVGEWKWVMDPDQIPLQQNAITKELDFSSAQSAFVPGDWNTQVKSLEGFSGMIWYKKDFQYRKSKDKRVFLHFDGVGSDATVWLNGTKLGSHSGAYTPFEFEVTDVLTQDSQNSIVICINSRTSTSGVPVPWFNYGGIVRKICLVETSKVFLKDYTIGLADEPMNRLKERAISLEFVLSEAVSNKVIKFDIPEIGYSRQFKTDSEGRVSHTVFASIELWSPENPRLYTVHISTDTESITEKIGFRTLSTDGGRLLLNGEPIFLCGVNMADESAFTNHFLANEDEIMTQVNWIKELGVNFLRLADHPHSEKILKIADELGILVWEEMPIPDGTFWDSLEVLGTLERQFDEIYSRDKNRCSGAFWALGKSYGTDSQRDGFMQEMASHVKNTDPTRLVTLMVPAPSRNNALNFTADDTSMKFMDVFAVEQTEAARPASVWEIPTGKPVIIDSFFPEYTASGRGREETIQDQLDLSRTVSNICGSIIGYVKDYRGADMASPKMTRKGHISDQGEHRSTIGIIRAWLDSHSKISK